MACGTEEVPIKINLIAPPLYVVTTSTPERQDGLKLLNDACETIQQTINAAGGTFNYKMAPKVVTATDEADLAKQLAQAELENAEVSGDDDDEQVGMGGGKNIEGGSDGAAAKKIIKVNEVNVRPVLYVFKGVHRAQERSIIRKEG